MIETFEQYVRKLVTDGYINEKGAPLKCLFCDSKELEDNYTYENHSAVENTVICKICKKPTGQWSYGSWEL